MKMSILIFLSGFFYAKIQNLEISPDENEKKVLLHLKKRKKAENIKRKPR